MNTTRVLREITQGQMTEVSGSSITRHSTDSGLLTRLQFYITPDSSRVIQLETECTGLRYGMLSESRRVSEVKGPDLLQFQVRHSRYFSPLFDASA
jgi:hypothetical protein